MDSGWFSLHGLIAHLKLMFSVVLKLQEVVWGREGIMTRGDIIPREELRSYSSALEETEATE